MQAITTIGLGIAKSVFQVHGVDEKSNVILRRQLKPLRPGILSSSHRAWVSATFFCSA
jgi:hypothetical protein